MLLDDVRTPAACSLLAGGLGRAVEVAFLLVFTRKLSLAEPCKMINSTFSVRANALDTLPYAKRLVSRCANGLPWR